MQDKPYGNALAALKTLTAVAWDANAHALLHRRALGAVLGATARVWVEGTAVTVQGIRLLTLLAAHEVRACSVTPLPSCQPRV